jgi:cytochrome c-type protein NapB
MKKVTLGILASTTILFSNVNIESCKSCHGADFEKAALGKSKIVKDMTKSEVSAALIGYKNGTYGDSMKGIMYNNVKMYTNKELSTTGIGVNNVIHREPIKSSIDLTSCKGCHGVDFEKASLGSSKIVRDMTREEVIEALLGYKNKNYGGSMKAVMEEKVKQYSEKELQTTGLGK